MNPTTRIILSTGDKYVITRPSQEIMEAIKHSPWIFVEDDGRDIAIRTDHIIALEEDRNPIVTALKAQEEANHE